MLIVDTGPLVAAADTADPDHESCLFLLESHDGPLVTTPLVITEAGWLIRRQLGTPAEALLYRSIEVGELDVEDLTQSDWVASRTSSRRTWTSDSTRPTLRSLRLPSGTK